MKQLAIAAALFAVAACAGGDDANDVDTAALGTPATTPSPAVNDTGLAADTGLMADSARIQDTSATMRPR